MRHRHIPLREHVGVNAVAIRPAENGELDTVAELRWEWLRETQGEPAVPRAEFVRHFVDWAKKNSSSHSCLVMVRGSVVIGMAWLAIISRVPTPRAFERESGDVQCVYVVPTERDAGLGGQLLDAILERAQETGLERVTVHSSARAIPAYLRHGFAASPRLLQAGLSRQGD